MKTNYIYSSIIIIMFLFCLTGCTANDTDIELIFTPTSVIQNELNKTQESPLENDSAAETQEPVNDIATILNSISPTDTFTPPTIPISAENINQVLPLAVKIIDDPRFRHSDLDYWNYSHLDIAPTVDMMAITTASKVQVYQLSTFELLTNVDYALNVRVSNGAVPHATFSPDGRFLAMYGGNDNGSNFFQVLDTQTWETVNLGAIRDESIINNPKYIIDSLVFLDNNQYILFGYEEGGILASLYEQNPQNVINNFSTKTRFRSSVSLSHDGSLIVGISSPTVSVLKTENLSDLVFENQFPTEIELGNKAVFSPSDNILVTSSADGELTVWNIDTDEILLKYNDSNEIGFKNVSFSSNGSLLFADHKVFDLQTGDEVYSPLHEFLIQNGIFYLGANQEGTILVSSQFGQIIYWGIPEN